MLSKPHGSRILHLVCTQLLSSLNTLLSCIFPNLTSCLWSPRSSPVHQVLVASAHLRWGHLHILEPIHSSNDESSLWKRYITPGCTLGTPLEQTLFCCCCCCFDHRTTFNFCKVRRAVLCVGVKSKGEIAFQHFHLKKGPAHLPLTI